MAGTDYGDSLRSTLDAARTQILDLGQSTVAQRQQAVLMLGHAEQALSVAENTLVRNQHDLATAYLINGMAVQGGALIQSADQLAEHAKAAADSASAAVSLAATSIKTLASAFDTLAGSIAGVHAIASNDDAGSAMARSAKTAEDRANSADNTVEQLKAASLSTSIQSAKSMAAAAATSVNAVGSEIQDLVDRAAALLGAAQQRVSDSTKQRAATVQVERAAQMTYRQSKIDSEALDDGTTNLDVVLNGGLVVTAVPVLPPPATPPAAGSAAASPPVTSSTATSPMATSPAAASSTATAPYLTATYTVAGASTDCCYFFALPERDAPGFSYNDARTVVPDIPGPSPVTGWTPTLGVQQPSKQGATQTYTATIVTSQTISGDDPTKPKPVPIAVGESYRVFAFRVPAAGRYATNASDLSYPSRTTEVQKPIPSLDGYRATIAVPPPNLSIQLTVPPDASKYVLEYRAFVLLEDVYQAVKDDAAFLAGLFSPSSYKALTAANVQGTATFVYQEGDTDAYGDIVTPDTNYEVLVMLVPRDVDNMASALLLAQPFTPPAPPAGASGPASQPPPSSGPPARTTAPAAKPAPEGAAPNATQTPPATGAK